MLTGHRPFGSQGKPFVPQDRQECLCYWRRKADEGSREMRRERKTMRVVWNTVLPQLG